MTQKSSHDAGYKMTPLVFYIRYKVVVLTGVYWTMLAIF